MPRDRIKFRRKRTFRELMKRGVDDPSIIPIPAYFDWVNPQPQPTPDPDPDPEPTNSFRLLESGDYLLLESGDKLILEGNPSIYAITYNSEAITYNGEAVTYSS